MYHTINKMDLCKKRRPSTEVGGWWKPGSGLGRTWAQGSGKADFKFCLCFELSLSDKHTLVL